MPGGIGDLQVVSSRVRIDVEQLAGQLESPDQTRLHRLRVDFFGRDSAGRYDRFRKRTVVRYGDAEAFQNACYAFPVAFVERGEEL